MNKDPETSSTGKKWTDEEDNQLIESLNNGTSIEDIAKEHKRIKKNVVDIEELVVSSIDPNSIDNICAMVNLKAEEIEKYLLEKKEKMTP